MCILSKNDSYIYSVNETLLLSKTFETMKTHTLKSFVILLLIVFIMPSCASIFTKTSYPVSINSNPEGAKISILDKDGKEVFNGVTPATAILNGSSKYMSGARYTVLLKTPGYEEHTAYITSKIEGWYWGNILLGGVIGMLIIDPLTGAMYKLDTTPINVTLSKENKETRLDIVDINSLSDEVKKGLVKLN